MTLEKVNTDYTYYIHFLSSAHSKVVSEMQVFLYKRLCHWRMRKMPFYRQLLLETLEFAA